MFEENQNINPENKTNKIPEKGFGSGSDTDGKSGSKSPNNDYNKGKNGPKKSEFFQIKNSENNKNNNKQDRKSAIVLPDISKSQGSLKLNIKRDNKSYFQRGNDKVRQSFNKTKLKINNAFIANEEEERLKRNRY
jgi:hypothetical protein